MNELGFENENENAPLGATGPAYIALPNERGPSDQTDLNCIVFLNPLGRWSIIHEAGADWPLGQGGRPRGARACCPEARSASRSFPWLLESSR